jgi:cell division transport system ATP-binding protein
VLEATGWRDKTLMNDRIDEVLTSVGMQTKSTKCLTNYLAANNNVLPLQERYSTIQNYLADEPTGNLDPETSNDIMTLLKSISTERQCCFMATHDYHMIQNFPGEAIKCEDGGVV